LRFCIFYASHIHFGFTYGKNLIKMKKKCKEMKKVVNKMSGMVIGSISLYQLFVCALLCGLCLFSIGA